MPKGNYKPTSGKRKACGQDHVWVPEKSPYVAFGNHERCKYCGVTRTLIGGRIIPNYKPELPV